MTRNCSGCRLTRGNQTPSQNRNVDMVRGARPRTQLLLGFAVLTVPIRSTEEPSAQNMALEQPVPHLVRVAEAARITGLPPSLLRKSFMTEEKRPKNVPPPPPHRRVGRAVYIIANELPAWIESLGKTSALPKKRRWGRPTVAERIKRRERELV